ncbi:MAG: type II toxin-antitoxin system RelE/ParE family toxin [Peptococcaceae bacterium]|nr:type II toxin-antitoxin system RelE/ParE family toxin [Peptococcaceae bacterium]
MIAVNKYLIFYKAHPEKVDILRVLNGARDYPKLFSQFSGKETGK